MDDLATDAISASDGIGLPGMKVRVSSDRGESFRTFTRRSRRLSVAGGGHDVDGCDVPVVEIRRDGEMVARLYFHPVLGMILSTEDLYF